MPCCAESGEIFIFPTGGAVPDFPPGGEHGLTPASSFDEVLEAELGEERALGVQKVSLPRPWVARVPDGEVEEWVKRLRAEGAVALACPNWRLSLSAPLEAPELRGVDFDRVHAARWIQEHNPSISPGDGDGVHVAVIDSGVAPTAVCCEKLNEPQLDLTDLGRQLLTPPYDPVGHGSLVAALIHFVAPGAHISSIRAFRGSTAKLSDLVYSLLALGLLPEAPQLANLSFSIDATGDRCPQCGFEEPGRDAGSQFESILDVMDAYGVPLPVLVAASGTRSLLPAPASIQQVIAVDTITDGMPLEAGRTNAEDGQRIALAAGGSRSRPIEGRAYGSSFAAAVATGTLARAGKRLFEVWKTPWRERAEAQERLLRELGDRGFQGYDAFKHGFGVLR